MLFLTTACVEPAEPEDGLVEDMPFVVNSASIFSFILKGNKYSFEESYALSLSTDSSDVITTTVSITEWSGTDTVWATIYTASDTVVTPYTFFGNTSLVTSQTVTDSTIPKKAILKGNKFKGVLEFVMAKN
jgi:hypothetical protein